MASNFDQPNLSLTTFGSSTSAGGWTSQDQYPRELADVNGDGRADIVGFASTGVYVSLAQPDGTFAAPGLVSGSFGSAASAGNWTSGDAYPREVADVNGDGRADLVGFGSAGVYVSLAQPDGTFAAPGLAIAGFTEGTGAGPSQDQVPRELADVNGDGRADLVGFWGVGVYVSLGRADGTFGPSIYASGEFGSDVFAGGWTSQNLFPRELADVNGDGRADIVGFQSNGVFVALGRADGSFAPSFQASSSFGSSGGWPSQDQTPRELADVNGDGRDDIVGFQSNGVVVALAQANGTFGAPTLVSGSFGSSASAGGWTSQDQSPREAADVNGDGHADIVGFGSAGTYVSLWHPDVMA